jgi:hypothetical protein
MIGFGEKNDKEFSVAGAADTGSHLINPLVRRWRRFTPVGTGKNLRNLRHRRIRFSDFWSATRIDEMTSKPGSAIGRHPIPSQVSSDFCRPRPPRCRGRIGRIALRWP